MGSFNAFFVSVAFIIVIVVYTVFFRNMLARGSYNLLELMMYPASLIVSLYILYRFFGRKTT